MGSGTQVGRDQLQGTAKLMRKVVPRSVLAVAAGKDLPTQRLVFVGQPVDQPLGFPLDVEVLIPAKLVNLPGATRSAAATGFLQVAHH